MSQSSQTVVLTGASAGVGRATAREFARRAARIALVARNEDALEAAAEEVRRAGGTALIVPTDVAQADQVAARSPQAMLSRHRGAVAAGAASLAAGATAALLRR